MMKTIELKTPSMSGEIYIGRGVIETQLPLLTAGVQCFVVTDSNVYSLYADWFQRYFLGTEIFVLSAGEESKNFQSLQSILEKMAGAGMRRNARLFAVGGGVIGDIGGLAAALYMRGILCIQIPTTLLAQVDSSVGGKTAVDLDGVKNLVGAFYQPREVLVCPQFLKTLPPREIKCGLGEIVKYAALSEEIFDDLSGAESFDLMYLTGLIEKSIRHKIGVVERDEKETGERKSLNVGHTTAHAIEPFYGLSHGESVLYGMYIETKIAIKYGVCEKGYGEKLLDIVTRALAVEPNKKENFVDIKQALVNAKADKKNIGDGKIRMAVAQKKCVWTELALSYEDYVNEVTAVANSL